MTRGEHIVSAVCILGGLTLMGLNLYELGRDHQRAETPACKPKYINRMDWYSPTEMRRIATARERQERIK